MQLDEYSANFSKELYSRFPEYKEYEELKEYDGYNEGYLLIQVPSPFDKETILWISTFSDEITIGFDWYHTHFSYSETDEEDFELAINHIEEIVQEKIAIAVIKKNGEWNRSYIIENKELPQVNENETIEIKSWNGQHFS